MIFGVVVLVEPLAGLVTLGFVIGLYACAAGLLEIGLGFRARRLGHTFSGGVRRRVVAGGS